MKRTHNIIPFVGHNVINKRLLNMPCINLRIRDIIRIVYLFLLTICSNTLCETTPIAKQARQWFEWGEYPQIIQTVPGWIADSAEVLDNLTRSELCLYLGVAYFAEGEVRKARKEFLSSVQLNPAITLDKNYVSSEIYDLFLASVDEVDQQEEERKKQALLVQQQNEDMNQTKQAMLDSLDRSVKRAKKRGFLVSAVITTFLAVGTGGYAGYEYYLGEQDYDKFLSAANRGDMVEYSRLKDEVKIHDIRTVISGSVASVSAITSTIFYIVARKQRYKNLRTNTFQVDSRFKLALGFNKINVTYTF
jgi:hypothetical protein